MYERILLPTDGSERGERAFDHAVAVATSFGATLHVLHVVDESGVPLDAHSAALLDASEASAREAVEDLVERASRRGVPAVTGAVREGVPHRAILDYADAEGCDLVVMGTHGRHGVDRYLHGSVTEHVLRRSTVPVLTVPPAGKAPVE